MYELLQKRERFGVCRVDDRSAEDMPAALAQHSGGSVKLLSLAARSGSLPNRNKIIFKALQNPEAINSCLQIHHLGDASIKTPE